jgi:hypothetical protein
VLEVVKRGLGIRGITVAVLGGGHGHQHRDGQELHHREAAFFVLLRFEALPSSETTFNIPA